jgi:hypothetical protein
LEESKRLIDGQWRLTSPYPPEFGVMEEVAGKEEEKKEVPANTSNLITKIVLLILLFSSLFIVS